MKGIVRLRNNIQEPENVRKEVIDALETRLGTKPAFNFDKGKGDQDPTMKAFFGGTSDYNWVQVHSIQSTTRKLYFDIDTKGHSQEEEKAINNSIKSVVKKYEGASYYSSSDR